MAGRRLIVNERIVRKFALIASGFAAAMLLLATIKEGGHQAGFG